MLSRLALVAATLMMLCSIALLGLVAAGFLVTLWRAIT